MPPKPDADSAVSAKASAVLPAADAMPVRVGVGVVGTLIVFGLIMVRAFDQPPAGARPVATSGSCASRERPSAPTAPTADRGHRLPCAQTLVRA